MALVTYTNARTGESFVAPAALAPALDRNPAWQRADAPATPETDTPTPVDLVKAVKEHPPTTPAPATTVRANRSRKGNK